MSLIRMDRRQWTVVLTSIGIIMPLLDVTIVNIALPTLERDLHVGFTELQWVVNAYSIPLAVFLVTGGKLGDIFGRKRLFLIGLAVFSAGSAICALTEPLSRLGLPALPILLAGRVIQGTGGAALLPVTLAIVNEAFHEHEDQRTRVIGLRGAMSGVGLALGPLAGGALLAWFDWSSIFWVNVPIGLAAIALSLGTIDESVDPRSTRRIDWFGAVMLSVSVLSLVLGMVLVDASAGKATLPVIALIAVGTILLGLFILGEIRMREPLYDLHLFADRSFTGSCATVFLLSAAILALLFFLTLYLQNVVRLSPILTGCALLPLTAMSLLAAPVAGALMPRFGPRWLVAGGMAAAAGGMALLGVSTPGDPPNWVPMLLAFLLIGSGMGLVNAPTVATATGTVGHEKAGLAAGINSVCRQIGVAVGIALIGAFITADFDARIVGAMPFHEAVLVEQAGTVAASARFREASPALASLRRLPDAAHVELLAQRVWIDALHLGLTVADVLLVSGAVVAVITLRRKHAT